MSDEFMRSTIHRHGVNRCPLLRREAPIRRGSIASHLLGLRRAGNDRSHSWMREKPSHGEIEKRMTLAPGEERQLLHSREILVRQQIAPLTEASAFGNRFAATVLAGEQAAGERKIWNE